MLIAPPQPPHGAGRHSQHLGDLQPRLASAQGSQNRFLSCHGLLHRRERVGHHHLHGGADLPSSRHLERTAHLLSGADKSCAPYTRVVACLDLLPYPPYRPEMDRRRFLLTSLAGTLTAPLAAEGQQQAGRVYRVGTFFSASREDAAPRIAALELSLASLGYVAGHNIVFMHRHADARLTTLAELAADLVQARVDVVVTSTNPTTVAMMKATSSIPIVMAVGVEPVSAGLVANITRPGATSPDSPSTWIRPSSRASASRSSRSCFRRSPARPCSGIPPTARRLSA